MKFGWRCTFGRLCLKQWGQWDPSENECRCRRGLGLGPGLFHYSDIRRQGSSKGDWRVPSEWEGKADECGNRKPHEKVTQEAGIDWPPALSVTFFKKKFTFWLWAYSSQPGMEPTSPALEVWVLFFFFAFGVLVPWPEIEPMTPVVEAWSLNHWTIREIPGSVDS